MEARGDDAVRRCFDESYRRLVGQLYGVCGDLAEAEDVVAEAFVRAVSRRRSFERLDNPEAWLRTVAVNVARTRHRRRALGERLLGRPHDLEPVLAAGVSDDRMAVVAALRTLPQEQREALALHYLADLPVAEVAEAVGAPVGTVKARLSRGRTALAAVLVAADADLGDEVTAPEYADLVRRGVRQRRVRAGMAAGAAALAVLLVVGVAQLVERGGRDVAPPPIAPSPTPSAAERSAAVDPANPAAIINNPSATLRSLDIDPESPEDAVAMWSCDRRCGGVRGVALAVTDDFFASRHVVPADADTLILSMGDGAFLVRRHGGLGEVIHSDGLTVPVTEGVAGPDAVPAFVWHGARSRLYLFDPRAATAEPLDVRGPGEAMRLPDGRIVALTGSFVEVSADGGASWDTLSADPSTPPHRLFTLVPAATSDVVVVEGEDGATLFPFEAVHRADRDQMVRIAEDTDPMRYLGGQVVLPDGRLLISVYGWSDDAFPPGYYVSNGSDWTTFTRIAGPPGAISGSGSGDPLDIGVTASTVTIIARGDTNDPASLPAYISTDAGETWRGFAAR